MPHKSHLLRFILLMPHTPATGVYTLKDLPGSGKRIDILCRCLQACFCWGPDTWPKENIEFVTILNGYRAITFRYSELMPSGEVRWGEVLKEVMTGNPPDFVSIEEIDLEDIIKRIHSGIGRIWVLHEDGADFDDQIDLKTSAQNSFMLGDNRGFVSRDMNVIRHLEIPMVNLGRTSYLGSHCVAGVISKFERMIDDVAKS